jgi:molybdopterin-containing oxidoreductase family iron-sulfur binding subunit
MSAIGSDKGNGTTPRLWRSLAELNGSAEFRRFLDDEFPSLAEAGLGVDRRSLLKLMGAALAFGGLAGCSEAESIVPYVRQPEHVIPGKPRYYATTLSSHGYGIGAVVESHAGRPTKVEGNPDHPASLGATDAIMQASVLELFDPDRSRTVLKKGIPSTWDAFLEEAVLLRNELARDGGRSFAILSDTTTSPTFAAQIAALKRQFPDMRHYRHDPLAGDADMQASSALFGKPLQPVLRPSRAKVIVSLDGDFLAEGPGRLAYAREFAKRRQPTADAGLVRLYALETTPTITGANADHRLAARPSEVEAIALALNDALAGNTAQANGDIPDWVRLAAADLKTAGGDALVVAGGAVTPLTSGIAMTINARLGALGRTMRLIEPLEGTAPDGDFATLAKRMLAGEIETLLVLGANPMHTAPADIPAAAAFAKVPRIIHTGLYLDETGTIADWHIPAAHDLESWSDRRAFDGTASITQPLILPLFNGRTTHELLAAIATDGPRPPLDLVRDIWRRQGLDDDGWAEALKVGIVAHTASADAGTGAPAALSALKPQRKSGQGMEIRFVADPWLRDGRFANNAWLQELPRPLTKLVWSNAALVSPAAAAELGVENGRIAVITAGERMIQAPVWIVPGHPDGALTLSFGYGRKDAGPVADMAGGYDAFALRSAEAPWSASGAIITPIDNERHLTTTQNHQAMEGKALARHATLAEFRDNPDFVHEGVPPPPTESLYPDWEYEPESWGMTIDLNACIGCMACVAACQAENNTPTVGPEECARGHEMHSLRIDRYYEGPPENPDTYFQPVPCMHCEKAPCEIVCPVNATVHTHDGLNAQVYNRCIGTRYCSQNCPYKVRRFNFLQYQEFGEEAGPQQAQHNPDVSVRSRGVMEKCTYCIQRISAARIEAQIAGRPIADGEVVTACQQACPTQAIVFGNMNDKDAAVSKSKRSPLNYALLGNLNTRPHTTYLGKVTNPAAPASSTASAPAKDSDHG